MRCLACSDRGVNVRTGYPCLECEKGLSLLRARLLDVRPPSLTDRLMTAWREVQAVMHEAPDAIAYDLWQANLRLFDAIDAIADIETVELLREGLRERRAHVGA
jgi:hypothetical protein